MPWVRRQAARDTHRCDLPYGSFAPAGNLGDLWRCDGCNRLWRIADAGPSAKAWRPATRWQRLRYRNA